MNSFYRENIKCYTPYHIFSTAKNLNLNGLIPNNNNILMNNFSHLGYQIMNPHFVSYKLEPIYSSTPSIGYGKSISYKKLPKVEVGEPVGGGNNNHNINYNYKYSFERSNKNNNTTLADKESFKSDTQLILEEIRKLHNSTNNSNSTKECTDKNREIKSYNSFENKKCPSTITQNVSPFIRYSNNSLINKKKILKKNIGFESFDKERMKTRCGISLKIFGNGKKKFLLRKKTKEEWLKLFKDFINIYIFWRSAKNYFINIQKRKKEINIKTSHIVKDIAIIKDWIISVQESFFNEFRNYDQFNSKLNLQSQSEKKQKLKKKVLKVIKIFIDNLVSSLDDMPYNVESVLIEYIKQKCYYPKKYLCRFQIYRIDFNFYGGTKNLTKCQSAMILSYLIINGVCIQQILLHIKDVFTEYSDCDDINGAVRNIGSILHYMVRDIFKEKQEIINDILALFNYYRNYHLYNEKIEKLKDKIHKKINIEEKDNEDEYSGLLLPYREVKDFFDNNNKYIDEFKDDIYNWAIELTENLNKKFYNDENNSSYKYKKRKIKSSIYG